ncbi:hypothetical protein [Luedemannella helvata]
MKNRWVPIGVLTGALFVINAAARLVSRMADIADAGAQTKLGLIAIAASSVVMIGAAAWWSVRHPVGRVVADLGAAGIVGALLTSLVGPLVGGAAPFASGLGFFLGQVLLFLAITAVGGLLGYLAVVALGRDWRGRGLQRYAQGYSSRPRRVVKG